MNSPNSLFPLLLLLLLLSLTLTHATTQPALPISTRPLRLKNRCRPSTIQRDALCACHVCTVFGLAPRSFTRRCARLFAATPRAMRRSCNVYMVPSPRGRVFQRRRLLANLRFVERRCPKMLRNGGGRVDVAGRMLSNFQIRRRIDRVLGIIREMLAHLEPVPAVSAAPVRVVVDKDQARKRVARLREYNDIRE